MFSSSSSDEELIKDEVFNFFLALLLLLECGELGRDRFGVCELLGVGADAPGLDLRLIWLFGVGTKELERDRRPRESGLEEPALDIGEDNWSLDMFLEELGDFLEAWLSDGEESRDELRDVFTV